MAVLARRRGRHAAIVVGLVEILVGGLFPLASGGPQVSQEPVLVAEKMLHGLGGGGESSIPGSAKEPVVLAEKHVAQRRETILLRRCGTN